MRWLGAVHQYGHSVATADSGETALACIAAQEFDLALIDLKMDGIGGIEGLVIVKQIVDLHGGRSK